MNPPYARMSIYEAIADSEGLSEYISVLKKPRNDAEARKQIAWLEKANKIVDRRLARRTLRFGDFSFVDNLDDAGALKDYILTEIPGSEIVRVHYGAGHGSISLSLDAHMPGFTMKNRAQLVEILMGSPFQPDLPREAYIVAKLWEREVNEVVERRKLWRKELKFFK